MDKAEVITLLGKADKNLGNELSYLISIGFDPCYLVIEFEKTLLKNNDRRCN